MLLVFKSPGNSYIDQAAGQQTVQQANQKLYRFYCKMQK